MVARSDGPNQQVWEQTGLAGTATIWFSIDSTGVVNDAYINRSSGNSDLDRLLLGVAETMEFRPATWEFG
jgi:TonB family protein